MKGQTCKGQGTSGEVCAAHVKEVTVGNQFAEGDWKGQGKQEVPQCQREIQGEEAEKVLGQERKVFSY